MDSGSIDLGKLRDELVRDEGFRASPYFDDKGYVSFGIGRNLVGNPLTNEEREYGKSVGFNSIRFIHYIFSNDIRSVLRDLDKNYPWWRELPLASQRGLANMRFQLGSVGFAKFQNSLALLKAGELKAAGIELRDSVWWREDTPERAERTIRLIEGSDVT